MIAVVLFSVFALSGCGEEELAECKVNGKDHQIDVGMGITQDRPTRGCVDTTESKCDTYGGLFLSSFSCDTSTWVQCGAGSELRVHNSESLEGQCTVLAAQTGLTINL